MDNTKRSYNELFKLVIVGDSGVGKSCFLLRYADDSFTESFISTIGVDFRFKSIKINEKIVRLQIWDTAGQERFRTITAAYYRGADGILIVYDITHRESFFAVSSWLEEALKYVDNGVPFVIIGNKSDRTDRQVSFDELEKFGKKHNILYAECSARTGENIDNVLLELANKLLLQKEKEKIIDVPKIDNIKPHKSSCC
jgi:Ras-related protein Rab-1A